MQCQDLRASQWRTLWKTPRERGYYVTELEEIVQANCTIIEGIKNELESQKRLPPSK